MTANDIEEQLSKYDSDITELKTRANYKEKQITDLALNMKEVNDKLDDIKQDIQKLTVKSIQGDSDMDIRVTSIEGKVDTIIKDLQNSNLNARVSSLENTVRILKWICATSISALSLIITALTFAMMHLH